MTKQYIQLENHSAIAYVKSFERTRDRGNVPVTVLGRNRNEYQNIGLNTAEYQLDLYIENSSNYRSLIKDLYNHKELKMTVHGDTDYNYYVVPSSIHRHPTSAGRTTEDYDLDVTLIGVDPLKYSGNVTGVHNLDGLNSTFGNYQTEGDVRTPLSLAFDVYDMNVTVHTYTSANINLTFGRQDQLGFEHLKEGYVEIPYLSYDINNWFWTKSPMSAFPDQYILPPLNLTRGNCTYKYVSDFDEDCWGADYDYLVKSWEWGVRFWSHLTSDFIQRVYVKDEDHVRFPDPKWEGFNVAPQFYWPGEADRPCESGFTDSRRGWGCLKYWDEEGHCKDPTVDSIHLFYGEEKTDNKLEPRLSYAVSALFVNLSNDWNFDKIAIVTDVEIPTYHYGKNIEGTNLFIYDNVNKSWNTLLTSSHLHPRHDQDLKHIRYEITQDNYSSYWNISGGLVLLFCTQLAGYQYINHDPPWDRYVDYYESDSQGRLKHGTSYLRVRVYRKEHRLGTILPRDYEHAQYIKIDGINNIPNNTVVLNIVNASSNYLGNQVYRTIKVAGSNWSGEHLIPLATVPFPTNSSYFGVTIQLENELLNPTTLPQVKLYDVADSSVALMYGGEVSFYAGNYGNVTESATYENMTYSGKSFVKEYKEFETLKSIEIRNIDERDRVTILRGPYVLGHYELNSHIGDKFNFNAFENISKTYFECSDEVSIGSNSISLNSGWITYIISPNAGIIDVPTIYIGGNVSEVLLSGDNEDYNEVPIAMNQTGYLGSADIDLRGMERFFLKLAGGNFSQLFVSCELGSRYNPLPWVYPDLINEFEYEKDKNINTTLSISYEHAYY